LGALSLTLRYSVARIANFVIGEYNYWAYTAALGTIYGLDLYIAFDSIYSRGRLVIAVDEDI
jgi:hypothetical protein